MRGGGPELKHTHRLSEGPGDQLWGKTYRNYDEKPRFKLFSWLVDFSTSKSRFFENPTRFFEKSLPLFWVRIWIEISKNRDLEVEKISNHEKKILVFHRSSYRFCPTVGPQDPQRSLGDLLAQDPPPPRAGVRITAFIWGALQKKLTLRKNTVLFRYERVYSRFEQPTFLQSLFYKFEPNDFFHRTFYLGEIAEKIESEHAEQGWARIDSRTTWLESLLVTRKLKWSMKKIVGLKFVKLNL